MPPGLHDGCQIHAAAVEHDRAEQHSAIHEIFHHWFGQYGIALHPADACAEKKQLNPEEATMDYVLIVMLWAGYCALHSYLISVRFTELLIRTLKDYYAFYRLLYVLFSLLLLIPLIRYTSQFQGAEIIPHDMPLSIVRSVLAWGAAGMFFWAFFFDYDPWSFFGIRQMLRFGKTDAPQPPGSIKKNGLLGVIRHPMYLTLIIFLWCQTFTALDIMVNAVLTAYIIIGTRLEEKKLVLEFGDAYIAYQQQVPMLIPFSKGKTVQQRFTRSA